jgi:hypothetical protein
MHLNMENLLTVAAALSALSVLVGLVISGYKIYAKNNQQSEDLREIKEEQRVLCKVLRILLQRSIEGGADGECKAALATLDDFLNIMAHKYDIKEHSHGKRC